MLDLETCFDHCRNDQIKSVLRLLFKFFEFFCILTHFLKTCQRIIDSEEKQAENSQLRMAEVKKKRLSKVFSQNQYEVKGSKKDNLQEYGSKKSKASDNDENPNISLSDITNLKPKIE